MLFILVVLAGKLDNPAPRASAPTATHKLDDPAGWPPRAIPASLRVEPEPEPERQPEPRPAPTPTVPPPTPAVYPDLCACVLATGECRCVAKAEAAAAKPKFEPPAAPKAPTFTPGVVRPPVATPLDEWRPFTANPSYEVYGHVDETGTFRYTQTRLKVGMAHQGVPTSYAAPTYAQPYQGLSAGSSCANGSCGQAQSFGFFGGRW
jgi:hypothetical protein